MKVGFKLTKEYRPVAKKHTANTNSNKKKGVDPTKENVETSGTSTTPIVDKIGKLEKLIIEGKITLVDDDGKPLKKVDYLGDHDSDDEVFSVDNAMARSMATETVSIYRGLVVGFPSGQSGSLVGRGPVITDTAAVCLPWTEVSYNNVHDRCNDVEDNDVEDDDDYDQSILSASQNSY
ncbi:hypothetical protein Tco_0731687 [Tanacetum coccineum]